MRFYSLLLIAVVVLLLASCTAPAITSTTTATVAPTVTIAPIPTPSGEPCLTTAKTYNLGLLPPGQIAFECDVDFIHGHSNLYVFDTVTGDIAQLTNNAFRNSDAQWSLDGTSLLFFTDQDGASSVYKKNVSGSESTQLVDGFLPRWSPDGKRIAFLKDDGVYVMNWDGSQVRKLVDDPTVIETSWVGLNLSWSPRGDRIAFSSWRDGNSEIYVVNVDNGQQVNLTRHAEYDALPKWSADGKTILFITARDNLPEIYKMNDDGTHPVRLTNTSYVGGWYDWSPNGQSIAFLLEGKKPYMMDSNGNQVRSITDMTGFDSAWSPDGKYLVSSDSNDQLYAVRIDNGQLIQLTEGPGRKLSPIWSPK
jgi:Tol biopolymer transport system component